MKDTSENKTTRELKNEAHSAQGELIRAEIALVRRELRDEIRSLEVSAAGLGVAAVAGLLGLHSLVETAIRSDTTSPRRGLLVSGSLLGLATLGLVVAYRALPTTKGAKAGSMQVFG